jgi:hypothetical protein
VSGVLEVGMMGERERGLVGICENGREKAWLKLCEG